jgi:hypothetical protein
MNGSELISKATNLAMKAVASGEAYPGTREKIERTVTHLVHYGEYEYWAARGQIGYAALDLIERSF